MNYDVVIVGGSFAGLAAALYLGRAHRSICVLDTSLPRNRFAAESHGFFAQDGSDPRAMLATMRRQVAAYPTVRFIDEAGVDASRNTDGSLSVELSGGTAVTGARLLLAFGITDIMPDVTGISARWGGSVLHCPYCHGYEVSGRRLGVLHVSPTSVQQALLVADWGPTTYFANGAEIGAGELAQLGKRGVEVVSAPVVELVGERNAPSGVLLSDGSTLPVGALFVSPPYRLNSDIAGRLGCDIQSGPLGPIITVDDTKMSTVEDIYAAGDISRAMQNITFACADGVMAAMSMHRSLVMGGPTRHSPTPHKA